MERDTIHPLKLVMKDINATVSFTVELVSISALQHSDYFALLVVFQQPPSMVRGCKLMHGHPFPLQVRRHTTYSISSDIINAEANMAEECEVRRH